MNTDQRQTTTPPLSGFYRDLLAHFKQTACKPMKNMGIWLFVQTASKISPVKIQIAVRNAG